MGSPDGSYLKRDPTLDNVIKREINSPGPAKAESFRKTDYRPQTRSPHSTEKRRGEGKGREGKKKKKTYQQFFLLCYILGVGRQRERDQNRGGGNRKLTARLFLIAAAQFFSALPTSEKKEKKRKTKRPVVALVGAVIVQGKTVCVSSLSEWRPDRVQGVRGFSSRRLQTR